MKGRFIDLTGKRFGKLVVICRGKKKSKDRCIFWLCKCDCGKEREVKSSNLINGTTKSCGCICTTFKDLVGQRFGRLTVLFRVASTKDRHAYWCCRCDCGKEVMVRGTHLYCGNTQSCGCYQREVTAVRTRMEYGLAAKRSVYDMYKFTAKRKNLSFELSFEQLIELTQHNCHYCDIEPNTFRGRKFNGSFVFNGIDRKDNTKGYIIENCLTACTKCNKAKGTMSYDEFISWGKKLGNNLNRDIPINSLPSISPVRSKYKPVVLESEYNDSRNICSN